MNKHSSLQELAKWWGDFQHSNAETQQVMIKSVGQARSGSRRTTRKRRKPRAAVQVMKRNVVGLYRA